MLTVRDIMTVSPCTVKPDTPLQEVIMTMKITGCRQLPVLDDEGHLVGIVTDRDIRLAMNSPIVLHGRWQDEDLLEQVKAESCMTPNPICVEPDTPAYRAAEMLSAYKFGALPVVDAGKMLGIITVTDFLDRFATEQPQAQAGD
ncbi:MAG TPA: CBS domain-containing protein [Anaerolineae bacterium]|jgi:CBS domain-containing protein|nr:CBS domain-containing protein [Anaerolineae bacterium]